MFIGGDPLLLLLIIALLLSGPALALHRRSNTRRAQQRGFEHSLVQSALPGLHLRKPEPEDVDQLVTLSREPHTMDANRWDIATADQHEAYLRSEGFQTFARVALVAELNTGEIVGVGSLDLRDGTADPSIGIHIAEAHGGRGFGTELMAAMIQLTQHVTYGSAWVGTAVDNQGLQHIMHKLGYEPFEETVMYRGSDGSMIESIWYQVGTEAF